MRTFIVVFVWWLAERTVRRVVTFPLITAATARRVAGPCGSFYWNGLTLIPARISNPMPSKAWGEITVNHSHTKMCVYPMYPNERSKATLIYWYTIGMDFRRIQLLVDNNYNPQKNIIAFFIVTVITGHYKIWYKVDLLRLNSLISQWKLSTMWKHDDVIKWKQFPRYWPFGRGIHRSPVNSSHKGQWRGALMFFWSAPEETLE